MNPFFIIFLGIPALEIFLFIKIGGEIGALNTIGLIFLTAIIGVYFTKLQGIQTLKSGMINLYKNRMPIYELISGATLAIAALLLIIPGFFTDFIGLLLLFPSTRKIIFAFTVKDKTVQKKKNNNTIEGEIIENKKDEL
tara:strand:- start:10457 stop:10873 length:417 start_codon:yes stop_codon:yes gene_type:complete